jgi:hypothetical protein
LLDAACLLKVYIKTVVEETGRVGVDLIHLAQGRRNQWLVHENIRLNPVGIM